MTSNTKNNLNKIVDQTQKTTMRHQDPPNKNTFEKTSTKTNNNFVEQVPPAHQLPDPVSVFLFLYFVGFLNDSLVLEPLGLVGWKLRVGFPKDLFGFGVLGPSWLLFSHWICSVLESCCLSGLDLEAPTVPSHSPLYC